jgi:transposase
MPNKIDVNPLLPFTCDDILYIITEEINEASGTVATSAGGRCDRRVNARSTLESHSSVPALGMGREQSVDIREAKAIELANRGRVVKRPNGWLVYSLNSSEKYYVKVLPLSCTCPDFELRQEPCKHILAVQIVLSREASGSPVEQDTETLPIKWPRKTYQQDWPNYDTAQENEKREFQYLLSDLCSTIARPEPKGGAKGGRPATPLSDVVFSSVFKVYCGLSGRRFATDLHEAQERGYVSQTVHHSTIARYLEDQQTTPLLVSLIEASALPFKAIETEFAVDSSGFSSCRFDRWYEEKWGRMMSKQSWAKVHAIVGTTTHIVVSVIIDHKDSPDSPQFAPLVKTAAKNFAIGQVTVDKAYASRENFNAVDAIGGTLYAAFKSSATGAAGGVYGRMYHLFCLNKEEYLRHYHRRSNIESLFSAVKRLFGDAVRSKSDTAMRNESLAKLLAYNITLLVHAIYELQLGPTFGDNPLGERPVILPMVRPG